MLKSRVVALDKLVLLYGSKGLDSMTDDQKERVKRLEEEINNGTEAAIELWFDLLANIIIGG